VTFLPYFSTCSDEAHHQAESCGTGQAGTSSVSLPGRTRLRMKADAWRRLHVEEAEDKLVQSTETAIGLMKAVLENVCCFSSLTSRLPDMCEEGVDADDGVFD